MINFVVSSLFLVLYQNYQNFYLKEAYNTLQRTLIMQNLANNEERFELFPKNETGFLDIIVYSDSSPIEVEDFYHLHLNKGIPFIYKNLAVNSFPGFNLLQSEEYWLSKIKDVKIRAERKPKLNKEFAYFAKNFSSIEMTYEEFVILHNNSDNEEFIHYWAEQPIPDEMLQEVRDPEFTSMLNLEDIFVWKGKGGTVSLAHTDDRDNVICQVLGQKEIVLAPLSQSYNVYSGENGYPANYSPVNFYNPDFEKHPRFANVKGKYYTRLEEGDCLYIPVQWWHHVKSSKESNLAINFFFTANHDSLQIGKLISGE